MRTSVSPSLRKLKAESSELPDVNVQEKDVGLVEFAAMAEPAAGERLSMLSSAWLLLALRLGGKELPEEVKVPERATEETAAVTVSEVSTSVTVIEPEVERVVLVSVREAVFGALVISGVSLVPVMVMVMVLLPLREGDALSVAVTV